MQPASEKQILQILGTILGLYDSGLFFSSSSFAGSRILEMFSFPNVSNLI